MVEVADFFYVHINDSKSHYMVSIKLYILIPTCACVCEQKHQVPLPYSALSVYI